ncbi:DUF1295 domain-containing protein [Pyruvatibacter sp.]|uniref:DUF1295 domain-containing protein n=1 Tax=Pyruvatibacter sp. TaxID=1981328 RepID=UPI0032ED55F8
MSGIDLILLNVAVMAATVFVLWLISLRLADVSFVDAFWPVGFGVVAWTTWFALSPEHPRAMLLLSLTSLWSIRLGTYLFARWLGEPHEDKRYQAMRRKRPHFKWQSIYVVFGLQGALIVIVGVPVIFGMANANAPLGVLDAIGVIAFTAGFLFESIADAQLAAFKRDEANNGKVLDTGLWAWTRHPNYFGNTLIWWGLFAIAVADHTNLWTLIGPAIMTWLIIRVSGADLLERGLQKSKPGYEDYVARTPKFIPRPPRKKRTQHAG